MANLQASSASAGEKSQESEGGAIAQALSDSEREQKANESENIGEKTRKAVGGAINQVLSGVERRRKEEAAEGVAQTRNPSQKSTYTIGTPTFPTFRGEKMNEEQKSRSQPQAPKDAAGVELRPYCRIGGVPEETEFYVRTRDVIQHIDNSKATVSEQSLGTKISKI